MKDLLARTRRPALHWSTCGAALPGTRVIDADLGRAVPAAWPPPMVIGAAHLLALAPAVGTVDRNLTVIKGARLIAQNGIIELADGSLLAEPSWHPDIAGRWLETRPRRARSRRQRGAWFSCLLTYAYSYYHWICEVLPRFHRVLDRLPRGTRFVVPHQMAAWQWDSLEALGIARAQCEQLPLDETWVIDELYYAAPVARCGDQDPAALQWVRDTILARPNSPVQPARRLYITRRLARRPVVNEMEIEPVLDRLGFTIVEAERLSFDDQVRWCASAECMVSPQGSGLANMLWSRPGIKVAEVFAPSFATQRADWTLACALGHRYLAAVAEDGDRQRGIRWPKDLACAVLQWASTP